MDQPIAKIIILAAVVAMVAAAAVWGWNAFNSATGDIPEDPQAAILDQLIEDINDADVSDTIKRDRCNILSSTYESWNISWNTGSDNNDRTGTAMTANSCVRQ